MTPSTGSWDLAYNSYALIQFCPFCYPCAVIIGDLSTSPFHTSVTKSCYALPHDVSKSDFSFLPRQLKLLSAASSPLVLTTDAQLPSNPNIQITPLSSLDNAPCSFHSPPLSPVATSTNSYQSELFVLCSSALPCSSPLSV